MSARKNDSTAYIRLTLPVSINTAIHSVCAKLPADEGVRIPGKSGTNL